MLARVLRILFTILALCAALSASASAQRNLDIEHFTPAPDGDGFLSITGTRTPGPWRWNLALWLDASRRPLIARSIDGSTRSIVSDRVGGDLLFQIGLGGRFALVVDAPLVLWQSGDANALDGAGDLQHVAIRDPRFAVRARVWGEDSTTERARHEGEGVALQLAATAPIGHERAFAGEGAPQLEGSVLADFHLLDFGIGASLGYRHRFAEPVLFGARFRNELFFGFAIQAPVVVVENVFALGEITTTTDLEHPFGNAASTVVEWLAGLRVNAVRDIQATFAAGSGSTNGVGTSEYKFIAGISFAPRVHDSDQDGVVDERDGCATLPEDFDAFEDDDGCPEPDNDGDLVPDLDDRCPNEAAEFGSDSDDDGCNDPSSTQMDPAAVDASPASSNESETPPMSEPADPPGTEVPPGAPTLPPVTVPVVPAPTAP